MRKNGALLPVISMLIVFVTYGSVSGHASEEGLAVLGKWRALSASFVSIDGDMEIFSDRIFWEKHGFISYRIIERKDDALFVELEKEVDCGRHMRIGPITTDRVSQGGLEVAFYQTKEDLQKPKRPKFYKKDELEYEMGCAQGVYVK